LDEANSLACKTCETGRNTGGLVGQTKCSACPAGKFFDVAIYGDRRCSDCPLGYYSDSLDSTDCKICGEKVNGVLKFSQKALKGSSLCTRCEAGEYGNEAGNKCFSCPFGWFTNEKGKFHCDSCQVGESFQSTSEACQDCDVGKFGGNMVGFSVPGACIDCPHGKWTDTKKTLVCKNCQQGEEWISSTQPCGLCDLGRRADVAGNCTICEAGKYQDGKGQRQCKACPTGRYGTEEGATAAAECINCKAGRSTGGLTGQVGQESCLCSKADETAAEGTEAFKGYYSSPLSEPNENGDLNTCQVCPEGASCASHDGLTLNQVATQPGFWRSAPNQDVFHDCSICALYLFFCG
jgi:hypothetical protein